MHQGIIEGGVGHVMGVPYVEVYGDRATATGHSVLIRHDPERQDFRVDRLSANRWELSRGEHG